MPDHQNDHPVEPEAGEASSGTGSSGGFEHVTISGSANVYQVAGRDISIRVPDLIQPAPQQPEDPRQVFLADVRAFRLKDASRSSLLSLVFLAAGATILLCGGVLALMRHGTSGGPTAPLMTSLAGVLIGTSGGALALHSKRAQRQLAAEVDRVADELAQDHTREETLALIDRIDDPVLKDRLMSVTAMKVLGLAPSPDDVTGHVFPATSRELPAIAPATLDED